jgi:hypothetical protein
MFYVVLPVRSLTAGFPDPALPFQDNAGFRVVPRLIWNGLSRRGFAWSMAWFYDRWGLRADAQWLEVSEVVVAGVGGAYPGLVVAGRLLGWHDAPGQRGSAGRHTDIRGLGPHVGHTQEGAPGYGRRAQATA